MIGPVPQYAVMPDGSLTMTIHPDLPPLRGLAPQPVGRDARLHAKAAELETAFLSEMLSHTGFGAARDSFGGGAGEDQFASFLRNEQAAQMVKAGGIGLTEALFRALSKGNANG